MKLFSCAHCGQLVYFENNRCEQCQHPLGFLTSTLQLEALVAQDIHSFTLYNQETARTTGNQLYAYCDNYQYGICNWLVEKNGDSKYCEACQLNHTIPDLRKPEYLQRWQVLEVAKHRLVYTLLRMKLPVISRRRNKEKGLFFDFLADASGGNAPRVLTGHINGVITINIAEADDIEREMARKAMEEPYRTVLGHFRHEIAHYYWDLLIRDSAHLEGFRQLFGDERRNYGEALQVHYHQRPLTGWQQQYISSYARAHPWEDWAETFAHYLHIMDTLETAYAFGLSVRPTVLEKKADLSIKVRVDPFELRDFNQVMSMWLPICFAMNSLNRSMGLKDSYPFIIPPKVVQKLSYIHLLCFTFRSS
ncbi:hypothetical protein GXP67_28625 [Rhodocytophaga rosea]|uniref:Zinc-ribbon domain-containing protein n=1 Tax=Rhodocytophaga rosea TaxID=2704465 RepID=A0A6C0GQY0_9BACT|nr:putative zinc-binding peptidase [Rhodocytophaga rosea]QHT70337.1 hypothetical protein GXP67_28625 [Rhodocytophaga rosea]